MGTDARDLKSRRWKIKQRSSISGAWGIAAGHFVFHMINDEVRRQFTVRFTGAGFGIGGGFDFDPAAPFENLGWEDLRCSNSFSMADLHGSKGTFRCGSLAALFKIEKVIISAWQSDDGYLRKGILFDGATLGKPTDVKPQTPSIGKNVKPGISAQVAELSGYWWVDS